MRAYMSQRWSYSVCDALACGTKEMSERVAGIYALSEARAILAETEGRPYEVERPVMIGFDVYMFETEIMGALAQSLAAFVSA